MHGQAEENIYIISPGLVHEDLDFQNKFLYVDSSDKADKHLTDDYWSARSLATAALIATIQRFVMEDSSSLSFEYIVKGKG
jgi:hypothetical protein